MYYIGGYYIAMACDEIVAEEFTITGSIGVVSSKFNAMELNKKVGFGVDAISRGRYAEVMKKHLISQSLSLCKFQIVYFTCLHHSSILSFSLSFLNPLFISTHLKGPQHFQRLYRGRGHILR